jgi:hypothetical protein
VKPKHEPHGLILGGLRRKFSRTVSLVAAAALLLLSQHLHADIPERSMANLQIEDQGNQLVVSWHFYYFLLPQRFVLHEKQDTPISLGTADDHLLEQNLSEIALGAFDFKVDGQTVQPTLLKLTTYPNKSCLVLLSYPGHPRSQVELRAPVLKYFPKGYFFSVSFWGSAGKQGALFGTNFPPVAHFVQGDLPRPQTKPFFSKDFISEWGAAWVNYNWILTCLVLLLMQKPKQIAVLIASIMLGWVSLCFAAALFDCKLSYKLSQMALCIPTVLVCIICVQYPKRGVLLTLVTVAAGLLNAYYDIQQIPLSVPAQTVNALVGVALGFTGGIALVLLVLVPIWWECKKFPGFQENWAPKISWIVTALAVFLPLQKWLFG